MKDWRQTIRIRDLVFERVQVNEPLNCTNVYLEEFNQPKVHTLSSFVFSLHNVYYQVLRVAIEESSGLIERCIAMHRRVNHWFFATSASILGALALDGAAPALFPVSS